MIECKNCRYKGCALCGTDHKIHAATCETYTPATHADELRAMSDEELANLFSEIVDCERGCDARKDKCWMTDSTCCLAWLDWLKEEAKE